MAWCCQPTSHYLSQCWPRCMLLYGLTMPQWVNTGGICWIYQCGGFDNDNTKAYNRAISNIPRQLSHNAPLCNRNVHTCAHFCYKVVHYGIWDCCIVGFLQQVYRLCTGIIAAHNWPIIAHLWGQAMGCLLGVQYGLLSPFMITVLYAI